MALQKLKLADIAFQPVFGRFQSFFRLPQLVFETV
jgi:hypothetical protein